MLILILLAGLARFGCSLKYLIPGQETGGIMVSKVIVSIELDKFERKLIT